MTAKKSIKSPITGNELKENIKLTLTPEQIKKEEQKKKELEETKALASEIEFEIIEIKYDLNWFYLRQKILSVKTIPAIIFAKFSKFTVKTEEIKNE